MTINYTALLSLAEPVTGTESGTWGDDVNKGITDYLDIAIAGTNTLSTDANVTLTSSQGASAANNITATTAQYMQLLFSGARTAARTVTVPASSKIYVVNNSTTGGFAVTVKTGTTAGVSIASGEKAVIAYDGADFVKVASSLISGLSGILPVANGGTGSSSLASITVGNATTAATATNIAGGTANQIAFQTGPSATSFAAAPSTIGTVLGWTGSAFSWVAAPAATSATNLVGGGAYTVVYQASAGSTAYLTNGTTGQVLTATTGGAPSWTTIDALPSQTGNAGKFLTTNGTAASWAASGASAGGVIWENTTNISSNYTLSTSKNGLSVGPITIDPGAAVTVPSGQRWVVL